MNFTGQVRVPEIDHPGVPATILVEDDQIEVFLEGESLGRWSLYDVHASRLVSAAFSLSLADEEITFIADEPVDFAYKGVDHMAEVWARYKSMTMPRRVVAVGRSRRGTTAPRISELREAMVQNLEAAGRGVPRLAPIETLRQPAFPQAPPVEEVAPASGEPMVPATPEPVIPRQTEPPFRPSSPETRPQPAPEAKEPSVTEEVASPPPAPAPPSRLRPGPGLLARRVTPPDDEVEEAEPIFARPGDKAPVFRSPWDEPTEAADLEPVSVQEPDLEPVLDEPPMPVFEPEPVAAQPPAPIFEPEPVLEKPEMPEPVVEPPAAVAPAASAEVPELVKELLGTSSDEGGEEGARDLVVDLGHYEGRRQAGPEEGPMASPAKEPVMTGAPPEASEKSGLLGAVRSAFARNKVPHEHEFVEAPGGIGIVRQICAECGYISIGVSD